MDDINSEIYQQFTLFNLKYIQADFLLENIKKKYNDKIVNQLILINELENNNTLSWLYRQRKNYEIMIIGKNNMDSYIKKLIEMRKDLLRMNMIYNKLFGDLYLSLIIKYNNFISNYFKMDLIIQQNIKEVLENIIKFISNN